MLAKHFLPKGNRVGGGAAANKLEKSRISRNKTKMRPNLLFFPLLLLKKLVSRVTRTQVLLLLRPSHQA